MSSTGTQTFSWALDMLKAGYWVQRNSWVSTVKVAGTQTIDRSKDLFLVRALPHPNVAQWDYKAPIHQHTPDGYLVPYAFPQSDVIANDWSTYP